MLVAQGTGQGVTGGWFGKPSYLGVWVSETPWGPFEQVHEENAWTPDNDPHSRAHAPQIPPKWIAPDGKSFWLVWTDVGSKGGGPTEEFLALHWDTGAVVTPSGSFTNPGMEIILGGATVDYPNQRVYFASRGNVGASSTLFGLKMNPSGLTLTGGWQHALGDLDGSPTFRQDALFGDRLFIGVGNLIQARNAATGALLYTAAAGLGMKGFVFQDRPNRDLYFSENAVSTGLVFGYNDTAPPWWRSRGFPSAAS